MNGKKRAATASAVCIATLAGCVALFSCAPVSASSENSEGSSYAELIEQFPLEYQSSQQERIADNGYSMSHSVSSFRDICEAPVVRDNNGADVVTEDGFNLIFGYEYNEETGEYTMPQLSDEQLKDLGLYQGCLSCKTSKFNDLFEKLGPEAFGSLYNADARDVVADEYWDCASCHNGTPSADTLSANIVYWQNLKDDSTSKWGDVRNEVCLQCHNSSDYRSKIKTDEDTRKRASVAERQRLRERLRNVLRGRDQLLRR